MMDWIDEVVRDVAELPERSSLDEHPEMMLVSGEELRAIIEARQKFVSISDVTEFMAVALRHAEYKRGTSGPTAAEIYQGFQRIGIPVLQPNTN